MTTEFIETLQKIEEVAKIIDKIGDKKVLAETIERIQLISDAIEKFGDIARIIEYAKEMEENIYACKTMLNLDEAARYMGISKSTLYKMTASRQMTYYKPNGRFILFEREELDELMRTNPIYSRKAIERMALNDSSIIPDKNAKSRK